MTRNLNNAFLLAGVVLAVGAIAVCMHHGSQSAKRVSEPVAATVTAPRAPFAEAKAEPRSPGVSEEGDSQILRYAIAEPEAILFAVEPPRSSGSGTVSTAWIPGQDRVRPDAAVEDRYVPPSPKASVKREPRAADWEEFFGLWTDSRLKRTEGFTFFRPDATFDACRLLLAPPASGFSIGLKYRWSF